MSYKEAIIELVERYIVKNPQEDIQIRFVSVHHERDWQLKRLSVFFIKKFYHLVKNPA